MTTGTPDEAVDRADTSTKPPVIFIHGLWLKPSCWDRWLGPFEAAGYTTLAPHWPAGAGGAAAPETIGEAVSHFARMVEALRRRPAIIGHAFGGLIAQMLAGHGLAAATVAIDPAPLRALPSPALAQRIEAGRRGPLLIISGEDERTVRPSVARTAYEHQSRNRHAITEFVQLPGRGRPLMIDRDWRDVAETALTFVKRFL